MPNFLMNFPHSARFQHLADLTGDNCCGSVSAIAVFEKMGLPYDATFFVREARDGNATPEYPESGSNVLGTCLAMAKTGLVDIELYSDIDFATIKLDDYEQEIADELLLLSNFSSHKAITIDEILNLITDDCIPIIPFFRDGDPNKGHYSPLRGINGNTLFLPFADPSYPNCNCDKDIFEKTWWTKDMLRACIVVKKKDADG